MMTQSWTMKTNGDPIGTIQSLISHVWKSMDLNGFILPDNGELPIRFLSDPGELTQVNPFKPLMTLNMAKFLSQAQQLHPGARLGVLLRPCEIRAMNAISEREKLDLGNLISICADCLGTYPAEDFQWRVDRKRSSDDLTKESLQFARQGGIAAYRYRSACQTCKSPVASEADINIGVFGLPVRQFLFIQTSDRSSNTQLHLEQLSQPALPEVIIQRDNTVAKILHRSSITRERIKNSLAVTFPSDIEAVMYQLENCGECRSCVDNCPICTSDFPSRNQDGRLSRDDVMSWLISCAGCGMCEQACPNHLPLKTIFGFIKEQLLENLDAPASYVI
jgi:formate dehydrogenase subunit beta